MFGTPLGCPRRSFGRLLVGVAFAGGLVHGSFSTGAQVPALTMHEDQLRQQAIDLLEPILGSTIEELTLDEFKSAAPLDGVRIWGHYGDDRDPEQQKWLRQLRARIDYEHRYVCALISTDPPIARVTVSGDGSARTAAQEFAQGHFVEWSDETQLVTENHHGSGLHLFRWANILPSGAWTGAQCSVIAHAENGGIRSFFQQRALRAVQEAEVAVTAAQARVTALQHISAKLPRGAELSVDVCRLVLSHRVAPDRGPLFELTVTVGSAAGNTTTAVEEVLVDGMTGKVLARKRE